MSDENKQGLRFAQDEGGRRLVAALADRYRVERQLGAGGMATVYLAHDLKHDRDVAIKVLHPDLGAALGAERFLLEIKTTANLRHPHIVPLYDSGEVKLSAADAGDGPQQLLYYVMPVVEGESLRDRLARDKQLPVADALRLAAEVADALAYAHTRGVIHRDIKPENLMLEGGHAVVADFGIARAVSAAGGERITQTGMSVGTPMYMSPEQASGSDELDGRSDQYSLACVAYEMLAGQPPFTGPNAAAITRQHMIAEPAPITNLRAGVPAAAVSALTRALAKAPVDRYASVAEFGAAMAGALTSGEAAATPASATGSGRPALPSAMASTATAASRRGPMMVAALVLVGLAAFGLWKRGATSAANATITTASIAVLPFTDLSADHANAFLGDGIAETLINALVNVPGLSVTARTSAFAMRNQASDLKALSRQLNVANVLEGSVQRAGEQLRITAQVVRVADGVTLWSQRFDRAAADIFAVQDEVARSAIQALQLKLAVVADTTAPVAMTKNAVAYDAYLLGRYHWNRRTTDGMIQATTAFKKAVALDSMYALAWTGLADTYTLSIPSEYNVPGINPDSILRLAEAAARRAIALAPTLGEAYASLGEVLEYRWQWADATAAFERGIALAPRYATGHQWYSYHLMVRNRWELAIHEMETAHRLDPLSHVITLSLAIAYDGADRFAEASPLYAQGLAQSPEAWYAWETLIGHELALGRLEPALAALRTLARGMHVDSATVGRLERGLRDPATRGTAADELARRIAPVPAIAFARWFEGEEAAFARMERVPTNKHGPNNPLGLYTALGPKLRANARVRALLPKFNWPPQDGGGAR